MVRGGELIQSTAPDNASEVPGFIFANPPDTTPEDCVELSADFNVGWSRSTRPCSSEAVLESETRVKKPVSRPKAIATTEISTATPRPRLIHSPAPRERFIAANARPPTARASARDVAAPAAYANSNSDVVMLAPFRAAPVKMRPNIGPAHGAHKTPVATPSRNEGSTAASCAPTELESLAPKFTNGLMARSARLGKISVNPKAARTTMAIARPYWFASTTHPPATAANVAIAANVTAMPTNIGRPLFAKGRSARANTNGSTGRIQGLMMVRTPPR